MHNDLANPVLITYFKRDFWLPRLSLKKKEACRGFEVLEKLILIPSIGRVFLLIAAQTYSPGRK